MTLASDRWNDLPAEERKRLRGILIEHQIRDYRIEMKRAQEAHRKHMADIRAHLKSCEDELTRWEREQRREK